MATRAFLVLLFISILWSTNDLCVDADDVIRATCVVANNSGIAPVYGTIHLWQQSSGGKTTLQIHLMGFNRSTQITDHGFHVHEFGLLGNKCNDAGAHYNPTNKDHGAPADTIRHVGDLGNIQVNTKGESDQQIIDSVVSLVGQQSVIGKAIVVHQTFDDLGRGNFSDSKTTGHAGARFGCCIIILDSSDASVPSPGQLLLMLMMLVFASLTLV